MFLKDIWIVQISTTILKYHVCLLRCCYVDAKVFWVVTYRLKSRVHLCIFKILWSLDMAWVSFMIISNNNHNNQILMDKNEAQRYMISNWILCLASNRSSCLWPYRNSCTDLCVFQRAGENAAAESVPRREAGVLSGVLVLVRRQWRS